MTIIDRLDAEWPTILRSRQMASALDRWRERHPALRFPTIAALVAAVERRDAEQSDRILAALVAEAARDDSAARLVLQLLLPGCKAMLRWSPPASQAERDERSAVVAAAAFDRIRNYPLERRPGKIAANILLDVRHRLGRWAADTGRPYVALHRLPEALVPTVEPGTDRVVEAVRLLSWAVREGHLDADTARLIALTRLGGVSVAAVASAEGVNEQTLRRRRLRAERRMQSVVNA